jgi:hypothetical protein
MKRFWEKVDRSGDCWLWTTGTLRHGYGAFFLDGKQRLAHRVAWELTHGPIPDGMMVMHRCDTPGCVRPNHLRLGTGFDNMGDAAEKGRMKRGESHYLTKLTERDVQVIRLLHDRIGLNQCELARRYNVGRVTIQGIVHRKSWKHVPDIQERTS